MSELLQYFKGLDDWTVVTDLIRQVKKSKGLVTLDDGRTMSLGGVTGRKRLIGAFRAKVCAFNRQRTIKEDIRSIFSGEVVKPGTYAYSRTLRLCGLRRYYSTCRDIEGRGSFIHPITGQRVLRSSRTGQRLVRQCAV
jgi:hypothetical protein